MNHFDYELQNIEERRYCELVATALDFLVEKSDFTSIVASHLHTICRTGDFIPISVALMQITNYYD